MDSFECHFFWKKIFFDKIMNGNSQYESNKDDTQKRVEKTQSTRLKFMLRLKNEKKKKSFFF